MLQIYLYQKSLEIWKTQINGAISLIQTLHYEFTTFNIQIATMKKKMISLSFMPSKAFWMYSKCTGTLPSKDFYMNLRMKIASLQDLPNRKYNLLPNLKAKCDSTDRKSYQLLSPVGRAEMTVIWRCPLLRVSREWWHLPVTS